MADHTRDRASSPVLDPSNRLKLMVFAANQSGGTNLTMAEGPPKGTWEDSKRIAEAADRAGIDGIVPVARWKDAGESPRPNRHRSLETLTWAAAVAAITERIQVFSTVHVPLYHALQIAKQGATIDQVSAGRFALNVVAGWNEPEFQMFGVGQRAHDERYRYADEWTDLLKQAWSTEAPFDFSGEFHDCRQIISEPKPLQQPLPPIMSAGFSPAGREYASKHADINFALLTKLDGTAEMIAAIKREAREKHGREIKIFGAGHIVCASTEAEARRRYDYAVEEKGDWSAAYAALGSLMPNSKSADYEMTRSMARRVIAGFFAWPLVGTPDQVIDGMRQLADCGIDGLALSWINYQEGIQQYQEELRPRLVQCGLRTA